MEQIPEKFLNENGELNTDALVKSYCELEKKIGGMISVPNENSDDDVKQKFKTICKFYTVIQRSFDKICLKESII